MAATVTFTWTPDPATMGSRVLAVANSLENQAAPLLAASEAMQADIRERFETETDPSGDPWEPWSESYRPYAESYPNVGILRQDQELVEAASSSKAFLIRGDTLFYQTSLLPSYGLAHEGGIADRDKAGTLPQRSFIGMSDEAAGVVFAAFSEWFDQSINLFVTSRGLIGRRHSIRGPSGFVSRASVGKSPLPRIFR